MENPVYNIYNIFFQSVHLVHTFSYIFLLSLYIIIIWKIGIKVFTSWAIVYKLKHYKQNRNLPFGSSKKKHNALNDALLGSTLQVYKEKYSTPLKTKTYF